MKALVSILILIILPIVLALAWKMYANAMKASD